MINGNIDSIFENVCVMTTKQIHSNISAIRQIASVQYVAAIHCGHLDAPSHGSKQGSSDVVDSVVTFSCDRGYRLQGSANRMCTTQGTWDVLEAKCVGQS